MDQEHSWDDEIELRKDPYRVKVGNDIFEFVAELDSDLFLSAYRKIHEVRKEATAIRKVREGTSDEDDEGLTPEQMERLTKTNKEYLGMLMLPESKKRFMGKSLPGRVITIMAQKVMTYYGGDRPTGPSNGSLSGSSTGGKSSTETSRSKVSTRKGGRRTG